MDLKTQVDKLRSNPLFSKIYAKHRQRRVRSNGKISLEKCQLNALKEFVERLRELEMGIEDLDTTEQNNDFHVMIAGEPMLNSEWKRLIQTQKEMGDVSLNPSPNWELRHIHYFKRLFRDDYGERKGKDKSVNIWEE